MAYTLDLAGRRKGHRIRKHSLKAPTIFALTTEIVKGISDSPPTIGPMDYMDFAAHDAAKIYSRNVAHQQLFVANFARSAIQVDMNPESTQSDPPVFSENTSQSDIEDSESEFKGEKPYDWATNPL